jgi:hypothetical protein
MFAREPDGRRHGRWADRELVQPPFALDVAEIAAR